MNGTFSELRFALRSLRRSPWYAVGVTVVLAPEISGVQQQRLAVARALAGAPSLLLAGEVEL